MKDKVVRVEEFQQSIKRNASALWNKQVWQNINAAMPEDGYVVYDSGQIIATSHDLTPNGGLVREIPLFQGNLGWWNIIIWPDDCPGLCFGWQFISNAMYMRSRFSESECSKLIVFFGFLFVPRTSCTIVWLFSACFTARCLHFVIPIPWHTKGLKYSATESC